ncbi:MAG: hypothetical protein K0U22_05905 [Bacteroidetes bacterium]|jgi:hypothetical protein|nr:hypothetical protein [Cryomorphaceae bacterium]MCH9810726.1 hypothetical protein [Bacteroidota bacterium]MCO4791135.1 hypothetical protein [Flavobacteriales bacterium]MDA9051395.1 hypothetical protein [Schleiferiaceae bacterium]MDA9945835.1 hypothetical protein [Schleiferiaceae bacterium]
MRPILLYCTIGLFAMSCAKEPWQIEMGSRLDSMVVLAKSHEQVMASTNLEQVGNSADVLGAYQIFFFEQLDEMTRLNVPKAIYTGPLETMKNCTKYLNRVRTAKDLTPEKNRLRLSNLRHDVLKGHLDSTTAIAYYNQEAMLLRDLDRTMNKSYGGCFTCLREYDALVVKLDSLKGFILEPDAIR